MIDKDFKTETGEAFMPELDSKLLERAGLSAAEVANILGVSRQAIYQGLSSGKRYFGLSELVAIVNTTIASDSPRIDSLLAFIEANYPSRECNLLLPDRVSLEQLTRATEDCERVIFGFNGNIEHISQASLFVRAFTKMYTEHLSKVCIVTRQTWLQECLTQQYGLSEKYPCVVSQEYQNPLSFVIVKSSTKPSRVFYFGQRALAEADTFNAHLLSLQIERLVK